MDYDNGFILQKTVDWSLLNDGMTIPVSSCSQFTPHNIDHFTRLQKQEVPILVRKWRDAEAV